MSIIQRLSSEIPRLRPANERNPIYRITQEYLPEIEEAKAAGYTWHQIGEAVSKECGERWQVGWNHYRIQDMYRAIKKGA